MPMRILVTGSRFWSREYAYVVRDAIVAHARNFAASEVTVVHGYCVDEEGRLRGADAWADLTAIRYGYGLERYPLGWKLGKAGGMIRNRYMVSLGANVCLAFPRDRSPGTRGCMNEARTARIPVEVTEWSEVAA